MYLQNLVMNNYYVLQCKITNFVFSVPPMNTFFTRIVLRVLAVVQDAISDLKAELRSLKSDLKAQQAKTREVESALN